MSQVQVSSVVQSSFFGQLPGRQWQAAISQVFPSVAGSVVFGGGAAALGFGGVARFARASECAAFLRAAGLAAAVQFVAGRLFVFVGPSPAAVASAFPWLVARG